ncbi:MAG: 16S rRNA (cytidine(1402)-2'-O)-methyltransferase [Candidatus Metalachnospira sp.]|nr:16S rRNA (cytidine(1402)-2'-O)-methyltransferase [Candidatus Metalachnospira sp.]
MSGTLYLCATPIGNLGDITIRVLEILKSVDVIAAEDTRNTIKLLNHFDIKTPMTSYHQHNMISKGPELIEKLKEGADIALVTDAGMPGISDPGEDMAKRCREEGIPVTIAPGASAGISALVLSGMDARRYIFEGFLPTDKKERNSVLKNLENETRTTVFYEAPHRLSDTLSALLKAAGDREAATVREITKRYEEVRHDTLEGLLNYYKETPPKGEFVIIVGGRSEKELRQEKIDSWNSITIEEHMDKYISEGMSEKEAMKLVSKDRGVSKREIYAYLNKD